MCGYSRWLSQYFCSRVDGLDPLPLGESFSSVRGVFLTFARVLESHLCHKTGVLYWALVSMLRACIDLRVIHSSGKAPRLTPAQLIAEQYRFYLICNNKYHQHIGSRAHMGSQSGSSTSGDLPTHLLVLSPDLYLYLNLCILCLCLFVTFVYFLNHTLSEKLPKHLLIISPVLYCL